MFWHNFKYTFKVLLKDKELVFWSIFWPIILGTLFYFAFSGMSDSSKLDVINLGVVDNDSYEESFVLSNTISSLSEETENQLFNTIYETEENLEIKLEEKEITGYIKVGDKPELIVRSNGLNQTIIKSVIDSSLIYSNMITSTEDYEYTEVLNIINSKQDINYTNNLSNKNMDYSVIEFYTLIAMAALFGAFVSIAVITSYLPNISNKGSRVSVTPIKRKYLLFSGLLAGLIIQILTMTLLLLYTYFILNVDYGNSILHVILLSFVGSIAGTSIGLFFGTLKTKNESSRVGLIIGYVMLGCFFAGMMGISMKYVIDTNIPIINKLNPAAMITDGFYSLYYYTDYTRYTYNVVSLLIFSALLIFLSFLLIRRKNYDSI